MLVGTVMQVRIVMLASKDSNAGKDSNTGKDGN